jgi:hypothetical protein
MIVKAKSPVDQNADPVRHPSCAGILEQSRGARNQVGIVLLYQPARLHRLPESIPGLLKCLKIPPL